MTEGKGQDAEELVGLVRAHDRAEAEMIKGLLESRGIPSLLLPIGIDGPQVGIGLLNPGGGSRRVMVHAHRLEEARVLLAEVLVEDERPESEGVTARQLEEDREGRARDYSLLGAYARAWLWSVGALAVAFGLFLLLRLT